jgi:4-amino-4-deoxy-L-arabinose transferase-like glycosyltransferase
MAEGLALGLAAVALWAFARFLSTGRGPLLVVAAAALGWGAVTRWQVGLLAFPLGAAAVLERRLCAAPAARRWWLLAALVALAVLVPELVAARDVPRALAGHEWLQRWSPLNAFRREFHNEEGPARYRLPVGLFYLVRLGWPDAIFPTVTALAGVGALALVRARRGVELALLIGWPLCNLAFISGIPYANPRFLWPALPALAALAGLGYRALLARLPGGLARWLAPALAASLVAGLAFGAREHAHTVARKNADRATVDWIDAVVPPETTLLMNGGTMMLEYYGRTRVRETYLIPPAGVPALLARACPCLYLENPAETEGADAKPLSRAFREALQANTTLTPIASHPPLVLFDVAPKR